MKCKTCNSIIATYVILVHIQFGIATHKALYITCGSIVSVVGPGRGYDSCASRLALIELKNMCLNVIGIFWSWCDSDCRNHRACSRIRLLLV